jgi:predicted phosphodiesterase
MMCPICGGTNTKKNGIRDGKQRYVCHDCDKVFADDLDDDYNSILKKIAERYSEAELKYIAEGHGTETARTAKPITFTGDTFKVLVITDTHEGSRWVDDSWLNAAINESKKQKVNEVWHCGDVVEGMSGRDGHVYELKAVGYSAQKKLAIERLKPFECPIKMISGNHDLWFMSKGDMGADIVEDICADIPGAEYLGQQEADIPLNGIKIRLFHGEDCSSYALSYRPQKIVESFSGGEKPAMLITGHDHKAGYFFIRNVHVLMAGCMQKQTPWMRRKKMAAMPGFYIVEICIASKEIKWLDIKFYPFYN